MASFNRYSSQNYAPSAPSLPENYTQQPFSPPSHTGQQPFSPPRPPSHHQSFPSPYNPDWQTHAQPSYGQPSSFKPDAYNPTYGHSSSLKPDAYNHGQSGYGQSGYNQVPPSYGQSAPSSYGYPPVGGSFPPGTNPEITQSFQMVDKDRSGYIEEKELQEALSFGYQKFSIRTVRLLMFLFKNPNDQLKIGPKEFAALWNCLGQWRGIFERFDRDRSGKIDLTELRDALYSLGYLVPPSVLQVLISKYDDGSGGRKRELNFDNFVECGMIVKGLTEKFKEKDTRYSGSATLNYDTFMSMVIPFIVP